eukprot:gene4339-21396_t
MPAPPATVPLPPPCLEARGRGCGAGGRRAQRPHRRRTAYIRPP